MPEQAQPLAASRLSEKARQALDELMTFECVQPWSTHRGAAGKCLTASIVAAMFFRVHEIPVRIVRFVGPRAPLTDVLAPRELERREELEQNVVELEGNVLVDLTFSMWDPSGLLRKIASVEEYLARYFEKVEVSVCGHCGRDDESSCQHLAPEVEAAIVHALGCRCTPRNMTQWKGVWLAKSLPLGSLVNELVGAEEEWGRERIANELAR
jgi:hypothetical protein